VEFGETGEPLDMDPRTYKNYVLVRVLMMGEKVADLADPERSSSDQAAAVEPPADPPFGGPPPNVQARPAPSGERVTVTIQEQHLDVQVQHGDQLLTVEMDVQSIQVRREPARKSDPLVLDLDGDGVEITRVEDGARFDLTGDGVAEQAAIAAYGDGFLALDRDGDERITSGRELFGDQHGAVNGFAELAKFDGNGDDRIDASDDVFESLRVWRDRDRDGISTAGELATLAQLGIESIGLRYHETAQDVNGSTLAQKGAYRRADGSIGEASDVLLSYRA
jgi:hypothetical protein